MGMYTEFHFNVHLRTDTPEEVRAILRYMINRQHRPASLPTHSLFLCSRWQMLFVCDSAYFAAITSSAFGEDEYSAVALSVRSNLKNYGDEIINFLSWITPYLDEMNDYFLGSFRYEENDSPTLIYRLDSGELLLKETIMEEAT